MPQTVEQRQPVHTPVLPDFRQRSMLLSGIIVAELLAFIMLVSPIGIPNYKAQIELWPAFLKISAFTISVTFASILVLAILQPRLMKLNNFMAMATSYIIVLIITAICSHIAWVYVVNPVVEVQDAIMVENLLGKTGPRLAIRIEQGNVDIIPIKYHVFVIRNLLVSAVIGLVALRYFYVAYSWRLKTEAEAEFRVHALQARIHPHFLFNSMNTIASLTRIDPELAEQAVEDLSALFRATLGDARKRVTLSEEMRLCQQYLHIEGLRLGKRLRTEWLMDAVPQDALMPSLSLQPLIENAIYYGIQPNPEGGTIYITAMTDGHDIKVDIENALPPDDAIVEHKGKGNHIALDNLRQRLQVYYDKQGKLEITPNDNGRYRVSLRFPYETDLKADNIRGLADT